MGILSHGIRLNNKMNGGTMLQNDDSIVMFGTLRLILAALVVMSHVEIYLKVPGFYWFSQGAAALVGFFILSGYLMKMIYLKRYENKLINIGVFWYDRFLRIYPHYYFYLFIIVIWILISQFSQLNWKILPIISHLTILPLNFLNFIPLQMLEGWAYWALVIPQAWTLASEFQFYLILPFLLRRKWIEYTALIISFIIFILAAFGILPTEAFGYRLLAGTLFIFLSGSLIYDVRFDSKNKKSPKLLFSVWLTMFPLLLGLIKFGKLAVPLNGPVIFGYLILVPVIYLLSGIKNRKIWDDWLGNLSYGVFLNHYWLIWVLDWLKFYPSPNLTDKWIGFFIVLPLSLIFSWISYNLIDKRIKNVRLWIRKEK